MKKHIDVFIFIDALGWEVIKDREFLNDILPYRTKTEMVFGYSATAIPTILTGKPPTKHKHLSFYYYNPEKSPFKLLKYLGLRFLPSKIFDRWRVRHLLSKIIAKLYRFTGYFEMYSMPFSRIHFFDYIEKTDLFVPGGIAPCENLADKLEKSGKKYHISNWRKSEKENVAALIGDIEDQKIEFAFLYTAAMDGLLHRVTKDGIEIGEKLAWYENQIRALINKIEDNYETYSLHVMSDHGMTTLTGTENVKKAINSLHLKFGKDYAAVFDSTMARFWYFNDNARDNIRNKLEQIPRSHILSQEEKIRFQIDFEDNMYGEDILLMDPGVQIEPCDMGLKALPAMHGFSPLHEDSYASFLSTEPINPKPQYVGDFFKIMLHKIES